MPKIALSVSHNLGAEEAKRRITHLVGECRKQFGCMVSDLEESWAGDTGRFGFRAMGFAVTGRLDVAPQAVDIEIAIPLAALPFKSRVEQEVFTHARELLA